MSEITFTILVLILVHGMSEGEHILGYVSSEKDDVFFSKFNFMSNNSSLQFEVAYSEEYEPLRLRGYWDSPMAWVDSFHMRVSCSKKQAILNRLSSGQIIHLYPSMNQWCQRMTLSTEIAEELQRVSRPIRENDWISVISSMLAKISGAIRDASDWLNPIASLVTPTVAVVSHSNQTAMKPKPSTPSKGLILPPVVQLAWQEHLKTQGASKLPQMTNWIYCRSPQIDLRFSRAVWWFFVLERCIDEQKPIPSTAPFQGSPSVMGVRAAYQITTRNGAPGEVFREHFSAEKFGNLEMDIAFLLFLLTLTFFAVVIAYEHCKSHHLHPTVVIWLFSIALRFVAQLMRLSLEFHFALTGVKSTALAVLTQLLYSTSISALFASLLVLSSGYTVVHRLLSRTVAITLSIVLALYTLINAATHIAMVFMEQQGDVLSHYHSKASYVFVSLQCAAWIGFCASCGYTIFSWSQKRLFFIRFAVIFSLWFWNIPLWTFVTMGVTHKRFTDNLIRVWDELITLGAYVLLLLILRPENANTVFPFHLPKTDGTSREAIVPPEKPSQAEKTLPKLLAPIQSTVSPVLPRSRPRTPDTPKATKPSVKPALPVVKPLPNIGGKPGDIPGPGFTLSHNLAELAEADAQWPKRPRTTPSMNAPKVKLEPKHGSAS